MAFCQRQGLSSFMANADSATTPLVASVVSATPVGEPSDDVLSSKWTVAQLKEYLKDHGGKLSGRKGDLLERWVHRVEQTIVHPPYSVTDLPRHHHRRSPSLYRYRRQVHESALSPRKYNFRRQTISLFFFSSALPELCSTVTIQMQQRQRRQLSVCAKKTAVQSMSILQDRLCPPASGGHKILLASLSSQQLQCLYTCPKRGRLLSGPGKEDSIVVAQKPLRRGHDFFFGGYVHDVCICPSESSVYVKYCIVLYCIVYIFHQDCRKSDIALIKPLS